MKNGKKIRFLELHNHYPDDYVDNINSVLGRYCAFGYHDAISISEVDEMTEDLGLWNKRSDIVSKKINGTSTMQVISVLFDVENEKKEQNFWNEENDEKYPYCFFTFIRVGESGKKEDIGAIIKEINWDFNCMAYYSFEHCEVLCVTRFDRYRLGIDKVKQICQKFSVCKSYTIFAVPEACLHMVNDSEKEIVNVVMKCNVKNHVNAENFLNYLEQILKSSNENIIFEKYDMVGQFDILVLVKGVVMKDILPLYAMGRLMTHSNPSYSGAFYNIETSFI